MEKKLSRLVTYVMVVFLLFSVCACGGDDKESVGSRDLLIGVWNGVSYLEQDWENGVQTTNQKEDFVNGTNRYSIELKEDGTYVGTDIYVPSGSISYDRGTWKYSGNKLTMTDTDDMDYAEVWTITKLSETELVYEWREKVKDEGMTYEGYEQFVFKR